MLLRARSSWTAAMVLCLVALGVAHLVLLLQNQPPTQPTRKTKSVRHSDKTLAAAHPQRWNGNDRSNQDDTPDKHNEEDDDDDNYDPFPPPLYGYRSLQEMSGRKNRFPAIQERVQVYMSNWYLPPCPPQRAKHGNDNNDDGFIHYRYVTPDDPTFAAPGTLLVREVQSAAAADIYSRIFLLDSNTTLGKVHFMVRDNMRPAQCDSEYCVDMLRHWVPAEERVGLNKNHSTQAPPPVLFQFSDDELSRAFSPTTHEREPYPNVPHLKKSRLALLPQDDSLDSSSLECSPVPKPILATVTEDEQHLHPVIYKLKTNRHYGMIGAIPPEDIPWSKKTDQAIFRGTLTGLLPPGSRFKLSTRSTYKSTLSDGEAEEKCLELDRCRLVYQVNRYYYHDKKSKSRLVDAKLVHPMLQHTDMPLDIHNVALFGDRVTKEGLLKYKAIIMLEGNDAGTGFKWALFSNSVVMTAETIKFTSWAMEELLQPWVHYVPLDPDNFEQDVHDKMQWVLDNDEKAQEIARRGSLWIRDLLLHPDAMSDDEAISDDMVRRFRAHFVYDDSLDPAFEAPDDDSESSFDEE